MALQVADTLDFLLGRWSIERTITDHRDARRGRFSGSAEVTPADGGARYLEEGTVSFGAHQGPARRTLRFMAAPDGRVRVDFQDGRPFFDLDLGGGSCEATHPCRADTYELSFEVLDADHIRERWRVTGPEKDYEADTLWRRL